MSKKFTGISLFFLIIVILSLPTHTSFMPVQNINNYKVDKPDKPNETDKVDKIEKNDNSLKLQKTKFPELGVSDPGNLKKSLMLQKTSLREMKKSHSKLGPRLRNYMSRGKAGITNLQPVISESRETPVEKLKLVLKLKDENAELSNSMEKYGGRIIRKRNNLLAVEVPVGRIEKLVEENDTIVMARFPLKLYPHGDISEGVAVTNADIFHDTVYKGSGVKVAVIDVGFMGLTGAISNGDLPQDVIQVDFSDLGLETEYVHGTACAEVIHDMAPEAELHLIKVGDETDNWELLDYCLANNIDIISMSLGTFGSGPGDGTGEFNAVFDEIRDAGILAVVSAGNQGNMKIDDPDNPGTETTIGFHYEGVFTPIDSVSDEDACLEGLFGIWDESKIHMFRFVYPTTDNNRIGAFPTFKDDGTPEDDELTIVMRWNDSWPGSAIDYDMILLEYFPDGDGPGATPETPVYFGDIPEDQFGNYGISLWPQDGTEESIPLEVISLDLEGTEDDFKVYALGVVMATCEEPEVEIEIHLGGTSAFLPIVPDYNNEGKYVPLSQSQGSITEPADSENVMAVGAVEYSNWATGIYEDFSSQGPTNDWNGSSERIKPDIMGPDGVATFAYTDLDNRPFYGTSAAAPHVAGMAALVLSSKPDLTADELQRFLESTAIDVHLSGKDNIFGWGKLEASFYADSDGDRIPDVWENQNSLSPQEDDADLDPDGDDCTNINEYLAGTLPGDSDTDDDGMPDGWEIQYGLYPLVDDAEGDLDNDDYTNINEYSFGTLPNNEDMDDDGIPDGLEDADKDGFVDPDETNPLDSDTDDDGMLDGWEVDYGLDPLLDDTDGDLDGDNYTNIEEFNAGTLPNDSDTDDDGIIDGNEDANHNGVVDSGETDPLDSDTDGDGIMDGVEDSNQDGVIDSGETDPLDSDTDDDGIMDGVEDSNQDGAVDSGETDPTDSDTDDDGMPDGWEVEYGLDPLVDDADGDADGDNFSNLEEYLEETIPNDAQSKPSRFMPWLPLLLE